MPKTPRKRKNRTCFNPFEEPSAHNKSKTDLRSFPVKHLPKFPTADEFSVLCSGCRKEVDNYKPDENVFNTQALSQELSQISSSLILTPIAQTFSSDFTLSHSIEEFCKVSPIQEKFLNRSTYKTQKCYKMYESISKKFKAQFEVDFETSTESLKKDFDSMIVKIQQRFHSESNKSRQIEYLSLLPDNWSISRIQKEFNCSKNQAIFAEKFREGNSYMTESSESVHPGNKPLDSKIRQKVLEYYKNQENVRELPGKKDFKSIKTDDGKRIHKQKKQLCYNLRELHCNFLERYPDFRVSFTKFVELKPQHCVL